MSKPLEFLAFLGITPKNSQLPTPNSQGGFGIWRLGFGIYDKTSQRTNSLFVRLASAVIALHVVMRLIVNGDAAFAGTNLFIHLMIFAAVAVFLLDRFLRRDGEFRLSGFEAPLFLFLVTILLSVLVAVYKEPSILYAVAYASLILLFLLVVDVRQELVSIIRSILFPTLFVIVLYALMQHFFFYDEAREFVRNHPERIAKELLQEFNERVEWGEVFGTFTLSNTFAGFLVLLIPYLLGTVLDLFSEGKGRFSVPVAFAHLLILLLSVVALFLTRSLGGWVSFGMAAIVYAMAVASDGFRKRRKLVVACALALVAISAVAAPYLFERSHSMRVRAVYWDAAIKIARDHPVTGIGINQFGEYYFGYKGPEQEETVKVHNDYLQLLVELGPLGLGAFLWFVALLAVKWRRHCVVDGTPPTAPAEMDGPMRWITLAAAGLAFAFAYVLQGTFNDIDGGPALVVILFCGWAGAFLTCSGRGAPVGKFARYGLIAGIAGFLIHMLVDFDFMVFGTAESFFLIAAILCVAAWGSAMPTLSIARFPHLLLSLAIAFVALLLYGTLLPSLNESERHMRLAERAEDPGKAEEHYQAASAADPLRVDPYVRLADLHREAGGKAGSNNLKEMDRRMEFAIAALERAIALNPRDADLWHRLGEVHREYAGRLLSSSATDGWFNAAKSESHRTKAEESFAQGARLYPTKAANRYSYGEILWENGKIEEARAEFDAALHMHEKAKEVKLRRLQLDERSLKTAEERARR